MITKQEFWNMIINKEKNIIFTNKSKLELILRNTYWINGKVIENGLQTNSRIRIDLFSDKEKYFGYININGYLIIKNPFKDDLENEKIPIDNKLIINRDDFNNNWLVKNWKFLQQNFKNDDEVIIFYIESYGQ